MKAYKYGDYDMNRKPMVKIPPTEEKIKQGSQDLSPVTKPVASKDKYSDKIMPKNTGVSSAKLQEISKLPGRVGKDGEHSKLS